jgi:hypothetical protein
VVVEVAMERGVERAKEEEEDGAISIWANYSASNQSLGENLLT